MENQVNVYSVIKSDRPGPTPLVLRVVVQEPPQYVVGGTPTSNAKLENFVCVSKLPLELQQRIELAVQVLIAGM